MDVALWRDISLLWLIFWTLLVILPVGVVLFFCIKGVHRLRQWIRQVAPMVQDKARLVAVTSERLGYRAIAPVVSVRARAAQVNSIRRATFRRKRA